MKKILFPILILLTIFAVNAANKTWLGTGASAKAAANWVGGTLPATGDVWILSSTNNVALTVDSNFTNAGIAVDAGYTATVSLQSYTITTTGDVNLGGATLSAGTSTLILTGAAAQTITSAGETWYDITINRSTAGTCLFSGATALHTLTASATNTQTISWTGTTMTVSGNPTIDGSGTLDCGNGITVTGASSNVHFGSTLGEVTATSCVLTMNTSTAGVIDDDKGITITRLIVDGSASNTGAVATTITNTDIPLVLSAGASLYLTQRLVLRLTGNGAFYSLGAGYTFTGNSSSGGLNMYIGSQGITVEVPAINFVTATAVQFDIGSTLAATWNFTGDFNISRCELFTRIIAVPGNPMTYNFASGGAHSFYIGKFSCGSVNVNLTTYNFDSSLFNITWFESTAYNSNEPAVFNFGSSIWSCSGVWGFGSNHTITGTAATTSVTFTGVGTTTSNGKTFPGNVVINSAGVLRTMADKFRCDGNFTVTAGKVIFGSLARDSIGGDYTNNLTGTDTLNRNSDSLWLGGSFSGNLRVKNDLSRSYLYGTALCNFTSNGTTVNYFDIRGDTRAKQMKLIDRYHGRKTMVTTGTLNTNGMDCFSDSFLVVQDSIATVLGDTISSPKITFGESAKPVNGTPLLLYFGLALADTMRDSLPTTVSLGNLSVKKTGSNLTFANKGRYDNVVITDGAIAFNAATDTLRCDSLNWQATDSSYITAPIIIGKTAGFVCAAGAKFAFSATGKIIMPDCTEGTTNGNTTVVLTYPGSCSATSHRRRPTLNCGLIIGVD